MFCTKHGKERKRTYEEKKRKKDTQIKSYLGRKREDSLKKYLEGSTSEIIWRFLLLPENPK